ncbi:stage III sporulation protein AA [Ligaoa zhengdingensis]|uniref:stage III sporulation protein AA n=1 Tax=Ligaoa zhengdingensis TaxID=2763658 RepID=UPI0031BB72BB
MDIQEVMERFERLCQIFPERIRQELLGLERPVQLAAQEIRLRTGRPVQVCSGADNLFLCGKGRTARRPGRDCLCATADEIYEVFRAVCGYSVHSHQNEIVQGYISYVGGHRVGLGGSAVSADGALTGMRDISSLNIRIAKQVLGCADDLLFHCNYGEKGLLLAGPPGSGKTTLLRDLTRQLASGEKGPVQKVALVDERGELAAMWQGVPQNDVGVCTDVLSGYGKRDGILMAVRALSPDVIVCDEIGREEDVDALKTGAVCGVRLVASIHAATEAEVLHKPFVHELAALGAFDRVVLLDGRRHVGRIQKVIDLGGETDETGGIHADYRVLFDGGAVSGGALEGEDDPVGGDDRPGGDDSE